VSDSLPNSREQCFLAIPDTFLVDDAATSLLQCLSMNLSIIGIQMILIGGLMTARPPARA